MRGSVRAGGLLAGCLVASSCSLDWDRLDPSLGSGGAATGSGVGMAGAGGGATSAGGADPTTSSTSTGGTGGTGGVGGAGGAGGDCGGGPSEPLVSRGLLTRYFLDEASGGTTPTALLDAAPDPLNLAITYAGGNTFSETDCQRGMSWPAISTDGRADALVLGTKVETALDGATAGTIECVLELLDADPGSSRISHIGTNTFTGRFTMFSDGPTSLGFDWDDQAGLVTETVEQWTVDHLALGRIVAHIVLDTALANASDRVRLFIDGVDQGPGDVAENPMAPKERRPRSSAAQRQLRPRQPHRGRSLLPGHAPLLRHVRRRPHRGRGAAERGRPHRRRRRAVVTRRHSLPLRAPRPARRPPACGRSRGSRSPPDGPR